MIDARFIAHALSASVKKNTDHKAREAAAKARRREREAGTRTGAHVSAPYPNSLAAITTDPLHWLYLKYDHEGKLARNRGQHCRPWIEYLADIGIRTKQDAAAYLAAKERTND